MNEANMNIMMKRAYQIAITEAVHKEINKKLPMMLTEQFACFCWVLGEGFGFTKKSMKKLLELWRPLQEDMIKRYEFEYHSDDATWLITRKLREIYGFDAEKELMEEGYDAV